ncbi:MAG: FHA domain-containing protein [Phycisphaerales bacterium]|nr:FHA domain-containing protein [Phycisphaerales bacterium]
MPELVISTFEGEALLRVNLAGRDVLTLGRSDRCDIRLRGADASRHHAVLVREGDRWMLINLSAARGMYDDERPVDRAVMQEDRPIRIGRVYAWLIGAATASDAPWSDAAATWVGESFRAVA